MHAVVLHLDFVSPYTWLALEDAPPFAERHGVRFDPNPVVYAKLLEASGLVGPIETPAKRRYTLADVVRCATLRGLRLAGPPAHPFRSLEALRTLELFRREPGALELAQAISAAAWSEGRDLTDVAVLASIVRERGVADLGADELARRLDEPQVKDAVRRNTETALERGVFGVPTFELQGEGEGEDGGELCPELFWGQDRMAHLAERLAGRLPSARAASAAMAARPEGARRRR